jgi:hypothetical protein
MSDLKLGRLPQKPVGRRFAIKYAHEYMAAAIPPPVYPIDVSRGITAWGMLGNDQYGDCGEAGQLHYQMATGAAGFSDQQAIDEYLTFTNGQDNGVVLADFLLWLYQKGEILGFAPVDLSNRAQADSLLQIFHGLYVGVSLTPDAQQLFQVSRWTMANGEQPDPQLGHCILQVAADVAQDDDTYVTWGALQGASRAWTTACVDEAWVVITTQDQAASANLDLLALFTDIDALGGVGKPHVVPDPPQPAPPRTWGCPLAPVVGVSSLLARLLK